MFGEEEGSEPNFVRTTINPHGTLVLMGQSIGPETDKFTLQKSALNFRFQLLDLVWQYCLCLAAK